MDSPLAGSSNTLPSPISISGSTPGVLDPSQVNRLLRQPNSKLSFASFDPRTAHIDGTKDFPDLGRLSLDEQSEHCRPKRIVIETTPKGASFWRFVPRARMEEGVLLHDEGFWPRVVEICGEKVHCTQDQWDIYKLDPEYDCLVQLSPKLSIISRVKSKEKAVPVPPKTPSRKRRPPSPHLNIPPQSTQKKPRPRSPSNVSSSTSEEDMSVDEIPRFRSQTAALGHRARKIRIQTEKSRKARREKILRFQAKWNRKDDENMFSPSEDASRTSTPKPRFQSMPTQSTGKRKVPPLDPSLRPVHNRSRPHPDIQEEDDDDGLSHGEFNGPAHKRTRTTSPECARKTTSKRVEREKGKQQRWGKIIQERKVGRDQRFMDDILADVPEFVFSENGETNGSDRKAAASDDPPNGSQDGDRNSSGDNGAPRDSEQPVDDETARRSALAESIRKLQDLEKDKPLWDEAAKKRIQRETAEEDERRARAEERRRMAAWKAELERRAKAEEEEKEARARAETKRREREAAAAKQTKQKRQERQSWESGPWTPSRALDRYKTLCDSFDNAKFSHSEPLMFEDVPWPVLPRSFSVEDVDWTAVERFFEAVRPHIRGDEYSGFVEKSHRRFHPDRWKSRRLLMSIVDHGDRECMEVAANTVAQALTPLWRNLKGQ